MTIPKSPFVLMIIDGFGYSNNPDYNAIAMAQTPTWDKLWNEYPKTLLNCSGKTVGLPNGQMGNSEVGHMNIGAGRIIYQDLTRIDNDIDSKVFFNNVTLNNLLAKQNKQSLHLIGLVSDGGVHSHLRHYMAVAEIAKKHNISNLYIHAFLDGRDTPPKSALDSLLILDNYLQDNDIGKIVSIVGRYYAMDRDKRWERTELAFDLLTNNFTIDNNDFYCAPDLKTAITQAYDRHETDEFVKPTIIAKSPKDYANYKVKDKDSVLFMNFRADRARQLSRLLINTNKIKLDKFATLTEYEAGLTNSIIYQPATYPNMLGEFIQDNNLNQLRIAETEKYAHVTFFFNGGREEPFNKEDRILIPSPKVATYDLKPEMSAYELTDELCKNIESNKYDLIICNYANPDMVGHTGSLDATIKAIETIDDCLTRVAKSISKSSGQLFITADHGNAECMFNPKTQQPHTAHTNSLVPLVYVSNKHTPKDLDISHEGMLQDIAPSILHLMGHTAPSEMTGKILFKIKEDI